jgi:hypothetical protein
MPIHHLRDASKAQGQIHNPQSLKASRDRWLTIDCGTV